MRNYYMEGYVACIHAIQAEATEHKDEINYENLQSQLKELDIIKTSEMDSYIDDSDIESLDEDAIIEIMKGRN